LKGYRVEKLEDKEQESAFLTFEDLDVYKKAREFRKRMYAVARTLPDFERYDLGSQIRRAAVSLTNNIAEGHGRYHFLDQIKFELHARGSLSELVDDLNVCEDENYLALSDLKILKEDAHEVQRLINGYIRYLRDKKSDASLLIRESAAEDESNAEFDALCNDLTL
jgi:four helix bundle protein